MAIRKSSDRANESSSKYTKAKSAEVSANITERFDDTTHNDNPYDDAIQYINKKLDDCIDEINLSDSSKVITSTEKSRVAANHAKVGITSTQASAIVANSAKLGFEVEMPTATDGHTVALSVTNDGRGTYALVFTMVDSTGRSPVTKTATVALR